MREKMNYILNFWGSILLILICIVALGFSLYFLAIGENVPNIAISIIGSLVILGYSAFDLYMYVKNKKEE